MIGSYYYYTYKNGRLIRRRSYHIKIHHKYGKEDDYRYFGRKRLVRPMCLCMAWNAFTIWKQNNDLDMMREYGLIIHNFQKKLDLPLTEFDICTGDEYGDEDGDESESRNEFNSYEDQGIYEDEKVIAKK